MCDDRYQEVCGEVRVSNCQPAWDRALFVVNVRCGFVCLLVLHSISILRRHFRQNGVSVEFARETARDHVARSRRSPLRVVAFHS